MNCWIILGNTLGLGFNWDSVFENLYLIWTKSYTLNHLKLGQWYNYVTIKLIC